MAQKIIHTTPSEEHGNRYSMYKIGSWLGITLILGYSLKKISLFQDFAGWIAFGFLVLMYVSDLSSNKKLKAYSKIVVSIPLLYVGYNILSFAFEIFSLGETDFAIFISIFGFILVGFAIFYIKKNKWVLNGKFDVIDRIINLFKKKKKNITHGKKKCLKCKGTIHNHKYTYCFKCYKKWKNKHN
jgi:hypothetical protein